MPSLSHAALALAGTVALGVAFAAAQPPGSPATEGLQRQRTARTKADDLSRGCLTCHAGIEPIHPTQTVQIGCTECHGGDASALRPSGADPGGAPYEEAKRRAHVQPLYPDRWPTSANPERTYTSLLQESPEFVRFINPGDLRVAQETCGPCHQEQVNRVLKSPMTTSSIFFGAAAYANGVLGQKATFLGESYGPGGRPNRVQVSPTPEQIARGGLPLLYPLPRWEVTQPGEYFRAFERGGALQPSMFPDIGNPNPLEEPGKPDIRLSNRGPGTGLRISPALINLHKTRLNDPHLSFLGTNDHPGDYRSSGCTACHVVYANDRARPTPARSAYGNQGMTATADPTIPKNEPGHPIHHSFTRACRPASACPATCTSRTRSSTATSAT